MPSTEGGTEDPPATVRVLGSGTLAQAARWSGLLMVWLLIGGYGLQGYRSVYSPPPNPFGRRIAVFDVNPRLLGTRNLLRCGINPYGVEGQRRIELHDFGEEVWDDPSIVDKRGFAYPIYVVFLYAPFALLLDFPEALLALFFVSLGLLAATVGMWYRLIWDELKVSKVTLLLGYCLTWFASYSVCWQRQPLMLTFFLLTLAAYLVMREKGRAGMAAAGGALFFATIKPQSSLFVVVFLIAWAIWVLPPERRRPFLGGFAGTAIVAVLAGLALVPTWIGDFLGGIATYQAAIGKTGAEAVFGKGSLIAEAAMVGVVVLGIALVVKALRARSAQVFVLTMAYLLVAQSLALQCVHYTAVMAIPAVFFAAWFCTSRRQEGRFVTPLLAAALALVTINQWYGFLVILAPRIPLLAAVRELLPISFYDVVAYNLIPPAVLSILWILGRVPSLEP